MIFWKWFKYLEMRNRLEEIGGKMIEFAYGVFVVGGREGKQMRCKCWIGKKIMGFVYGFRWIKNPK